MTCDGAGALRRGEAAGLTWPDIDLDAARLTLSQQLPGEDGTLLFGPPKSQTSRRIMPLDRVSAAPSPGGAAQPVAGRRTLAVGGPCVHPRGWPAAAVGVHHRHFQRLAPADPSARLVSWRSAACPCGRRGPQGRPGPLGHSSIVLTADTYITVLPELARQAAEGVAALIVAAARRPPGCRPHARGWSHPAAPWPHHKQSRSLPGHERPVQDGWGARGSNPEPTD